MLYEEEKNKALKDISYQYKQYSDRYDQEEKALNAQEIIFYKDLVHQVVENFKRTNDLQSKKDFINILSVLSSIKEKRLDRNQFIIGEDRQFIKNFLYSNFSGKNLKACSGTFYTTYENNVNYSSCTALAAGGGSIGAGRAFECQSNKKTNFRLATPEACDLAISSMLPYANLDGNGYTFTNFLKAYYEEPMFGQILAMAVKSTLLTNYKGEEALSQFITEAIKKENEVRNKENGFWETMNLFTAEGLSNYFMYDSKYCQHNLCASADTGYNSPNAWEEVALMLADAGKTNILKQVTAQCKIVNDKENKTQHLVCGGIYPLLFGTLLYKPELAESLQENRPFVERPGQTMNKYGKIEFIDQEKAKNNKKLNDSIDLLKKYGKAELMAAYLIYQSFEDIHPAGKMRMINKVAGQNTLNPHKKVVSYDKDSNIYKKSLNKYNAKQVIWGLSSYADILIAIVATKDLVRIIGTGVIKIKNFVSFMNVLRKFNKVPLSFAKSVKIANALKAKGVGLDYVKKMNNLRKVANSPIKMAKSAVITRLGGESQALIGSVSGRILDVKNGVLIGTQEVLRPVSKSYKSSYTFRQTPLGGIYSTRANNLPVAAKAAVPVEKLSVWKKVKDAILWLNPFFKKDEFIPINTEKLTLQIVNKHNKPVKIESISIKDNVLFVNDKMFKLFKATLPEDQLEIITKLVKKHKITLGIDGIYIKPSWKDFKPNLKQKLISRDTATEFVNVYDARGKVVMQLGLNRGFPQEASLLEKLGVADPRKRLFKKNKAQILPKDKTNSRLVYFNNALYLEEGANLIRLEGLQGFSLPKTAILNMTKNKKAAFLTDLFSMPSKTPYETPLKFSITKSKIWPIFFSNLLSYSAAGSGLLLTMEQKPFNLSSAASVTLGLLLPYITSFVAPVFAPLVSKWGARTFLNISYGLAAGVLGLAWATGYRGQVTYQTDKDKRVLKVDEAKKELWQNDPEKKDLIDKDGRLFKTKDQLLPVWPLYLTAGLTGLASSGVRAASNILLKGYEINRSSMTLSMLFKNIGGLTFTLIPFCLNRFASGFEIKSLDIKVKGNDKFVDFSSAYFALFCGTLGMMGWIRLRMPKLATPGYEFNRADFIRPWKLLTNPKIYPYVGGMVLASSLEGYALFKGTATFARERWQDPNWTPNNPDDDFADRENAKFLGALSTALPQMIIRAWSPRKVFYGRGLFNSAILSTAGTTLLLIPSEKHSVGENIALGTAAGFMIGFGTANVFQYSQKLIIKQAELLTAIPNARRDAQILYSMSNLGLALPFFYGLNADKRKAEYGEGEFDATRHSFHLPLLSYALGMGLILDAERNASRIGQGIFRLSNALLVKPTRYLVLPATRYTFEGSILTKHLRQDSFKSLNSQTPNFIPKLNLRPIQDMKLDLNPKGPVLVPVFTKADTKEENKESESQD